MPEYIKEHGIDGLKFLYATQEGVDWYDPLKPYTLLEYQWVMDNIVIAGQTVIDAGCHHGNYSIIFGKAYKLFCADPHYQNVCIARENLSINKIKGEVLHCAVMPYNGEVGFNGRTNGRVGAGAPVKCATLATICNRAHIVKLDVEGAEFSILPDAIDDMWGVHTWIVEVHPTDGDPNQLVLEFQERGFDVLKVDRERMEVLPIEQTNGWKTHATIIARRK